MPIFDTTRLQSKLSFHEALKSIIEKYSCSSSKEDDGNGGKSLQNPSSLHDGDENFKEEEEDDDDDDIIDLETMTLVRNRGKLARMKEFPFGSFIKETPQEAIESKQRQIRTSSLRNHNNDSDSQDEDEDRNAYLGSYSDDNVESESENGNHHHYVFKEDDDGEEKENVSPTASENIGDKDFGNNESSLVYEEENGFQFVTLPSDNELGSDEDVYYYNEYEDVFERLNGDSFNPNDESLWDSPGPTTSTKQEIPPIATENQGTDEKDSKARENCKSNAKFKKKPLRSITEIKNTCKQKRLEVLALLQDKEDEEYEKLGKEFIKQPQPTLEKDRENNYKPKSLHPEIYHQVETKTDDKPKKRNDGKPSNLTGGKKTEKKRSDKSMVETFVDSGLSTIPSKPSLEMTSKSTIEMTSRPKMETPSKSPIKIPSKPPITMTRKPTISQQAKPTISQQIKPTISQQIKPTISQQIKPAVTHQTKSAVTHQAKPSIPKTLSKNSDMKKIPATISSDLITAIQITSDPYPSSSAPLKASLASQSLPKPKPQSFQPLIADPQDDEDKGKKRKRKYFIQANRMAQLNDQRSKYLQLLSESLDKTQPMNLKEAREKVFEKLQKPIISTSTVQVVKHSSDDSIVANPIIIKSKFDYSKTFNNNEDDDDDFVQPLRKPVKK